MSQLVCGQYDDYSDMIRMVALANIPNHDWEFSYDLIEVGPPDRPWKILELKLKGTTYGATTHVPWELMLKARAPDHIVATEVRALVVMVRHRECHYDKMDNEDLLKSAALKTLPSGGSWKFDSGMISGTEDVEVTLTWRDTKNALSPIVKAKRRLPIYRLTPSYVAEQEMRKEFVSMMNEINRKKELL